VVDALRAQLVAQREEVRQQSWRDRRDVEPAEPDAGLGGGLRPPQVGVVRRQSLREALVADHRERLLLGQRG
jgi:hypothetical protein